jgi:hypothetical protein
LAFGFWLGLGFNGCPHIGSNTHGMLIAVTLTLTLTLALTLILTLALTLTLDPNPNCEL